MLQSRLDVLSILGGRPPSTEGWYFPIFPVATCGCSRISADSDVDGLRRNSKPGPNAEVITLEALHISLRHLVTSAEGYCEYGSTHRQASDDPHTRDRAPCRCGASDVTRSTWLIRVRLSELLDMSTARRTYLTSEHLYQAQYHRGGHHRRWTRAPTASCYNYSPDVRHNP